MMNVSTLLRNLSSIGAMRLGTAGLSFLLFWLLSHLLGSEALGAFSLLFGVYLFAQYLPLLGLYIAIVRDAALPETDMPRLIANANAIALPTGVVVAILIGTIGTVFYPQNLHTAFWLVGLSIVPTAWTDVVEASLMGQQRMSIMATVNLGEALLRALGGGIAVAQGFGLTGVFVVFFVCRCMAMLGYVMRSGLPHAPLRLIDQRRVRAYLHECPVFFAILVLSMLASRVDLFMLSRLVPLGEMGVYSVGTKIYEAMLMVPSVVATALYPALVGAREISINSYEKLISQAVFWALIIGLPFVIAMGILSTPLIALLFSAEFRSAASVLQWLAPATLLTALDQILACAMLSSGAQRKDLAALCLGVAVQIILIAILVSHFGITGAAAAVALAIGTRILWRLRWLMGTTTSFSPTRQLLYPLLAGLPALSVQWLLPAIHWSAQLLLALCVFAGSLRVLKVANQDSFKQLKSTLALLRRRKAG
jgi:O-antigen/teichoic acid export membrane protein